MPASPDIDGTHGHPTSSHEICINLTLSSALASCRREVAGSRGLADMFVALLQGIMSPKEGVGIGATQLEWLKSELERAEDAGERVMVAAHDPLVLGKR